MPKQSGDSPLDVLGAIREDLDRRSEAKKNLISALTSYLGELQRDPAGSPTSIVTLAEIWREYAVILYDSLAERHFSGSPDIETLFGESGELYGGTTIKDVKDVLANLRVPPGSGWLEPNFSRDGDSLEMVNTMRALAHTLTASPYSFSWLLNEGWFNTEIWNSIRGRTDHWRQKFEQRFGPNRHPIQTPHLTSQEPPPTVSSEVRLRRREILKRYLVEAATWDRVQQILQRNGRNGGTEVRDSYGALLKGLLRCAACDGGMIRTYKTKDSRRYRQYVCAHTQEQGSANCQTKSVAEPVIQALVIRQVRRIGSDSRIVESAVAKADEQRRSNVGDLAVEHETKEIGETGNPIARAGPHGGLRRPDGCGPQHGRSPGAYR